MIEEGVTTISFSPHAQYASAHLCKIACFTANSESSYFGSSCEKNAPLQSIRTW